MKTYYDLDCELAEQNRIDEEREAAELPTYKKFLNMLKDAMFTYTGRVYSEFTDMYVYSNAIKTIFMKMDKTKANELLDLAEHYKHFFHTDIKIYRELSLPAKVYNKELNK